MSREAGELTCREHSKQVRHFPVITLRPHSHPGGVEVCSIPTRQVQRLRPWGFVLLADAVHGYSVLELGF